LGVKIHPWLTRKAFPAMAIVPLQDDTDLRICSSDTHICINVWVAASVNKKDSTPDYGLDHQPKWFTHMASR